MIRTPMAGDWEDDLIPWSWAWFLECPTCHRTCESRPYYDDDPAEGGECLGEQVRCSPCGFYEEY